MWDLTAKEGDVERCRGEESGDRGRLSVNEGKESDDME